MVCLFLLEKIQVIVQYTPSRAHPRQHILSCISTRSFGHAGHQLLSQLSHSVHRYQLFLPRFCVCWFHIVSMPNCSHMCHDMKHAPAHTPHSRSAPWLGSSYVAFRIFSSLLSYQALSARSVLPCFFVASFWFFSCCLRSSFFAAASASRAALSACF
jgi:hypothetical protein